MGFGFRNSGRGCSAPPGAVQVFRETFCLTAVLRTSRLTAVRRRVIGNVQTHGCTGTYRKLEDGVHGERCTGKLAERPCKDGRIGGLRTASTVSAARGSFWIDRAKIISRRAGRINLNNLYGLTPPLDRRRLLCPRSDGWRRGSLTLWLNWGHVVIFSDQFWAQRKTPATLFTSKNGTNILIIFWSQKCTQFIYFAPIFVKYIGPSLHADFGVVTPLSKLGPHFKF